MYLTELYNNIANDYRSEKDDNSVLRLRDLRKTRLTLAHLNKLRMANDIRKLEKEQEVESLSDQYKPPAPEGGLPSM